MITGAPRIEPAFATVTEAMQAAARAGVGLTFLDADERASAYPWADLLARAQRVAGALVELGVRKGDRVALVLPTAPAFCDAFFGAMWAGAVPVPLYPPVRLGRMAEYHRQTARMIEAVDAKVVLTDSRIRLLLGKVVEQARPPLGVFTVEDLLKSGSAGPAVAPPRPDELGLIQFSSGSTVDPKPVALTHRALVSQAAALKALLPHAEGSAVCGVSWLPLYHDMGLIGALLTAPYYPGELVLIPPEAFLARPAIWLRAISKFGGTISAAPNFAYALCLKRVADQELAGVDLSRWSYALNGAEPVSVSLASRFAQRFSRWGFRPESMMPVYGLSEAALAVTFSARRSPLRSLAVEPTVLAQTREVVRGTRELASVGAPLPGVQVEIRAEGGAPCPDRKVGRVMVRGPSMMNGYFRQGAVSGDALEEGWLDTGDLGFLDQGELFISGRSKDLVVIRGANHPPQEFEECLEGLPGLRAGCAVALGFVPEATGEEGLLILAELSQGATPTLQSEIETAILTRTGVRPSAVALLSPGTLPRTSSGKMRRAEALRRFLAGELDPPKPVTRVRVAAEMARSAVAYAKAKWS